MTTSRKDIQERFHRAALEAYNRHGFRSYRHAEQMTGVNYSTIYVIVSRGRLPARGQVIEWAEGLKEPINYWLELAGYDPISSSLVANGVEENEAEFLLIKAYRGAKDERARKHLEQAAREAIADEEAENERS